MFEYTLFLCVFFIGKTLVPKGINEVKLIGSGKILENNKTVAQCKTPFGEVAGGVTLMLIHVVVQPSLSKAKTGFFFFFLSMHIRKKCTLSWRFMCYLFILSFTCLAYVIFAFWLPFLLLIASSASSYIHKDDNKSLSF